MLDPAVSEALRYPLFALAILADILSALLIATTWQSLPSQIPAHFGITGQPDRWGGRWHLFLLLAIQTGLNVTMWLKRSDDLLVNWLQTVTSLLFCFVIWSTIRVARGEARRLNPLLLYGLIASLVGPAIARAFK